MSGLPDLRIKKPISGKPEIGAQLSVSHFARLADLAEVPKNNRHGAARLGLRRVTLTPQE